MVLLEDLLDKLRYAGYKITDARRTVLGVFCNADSHLTSTEVISRVESIDPSIGRASIFRALELLTGLAIIRPSFTQPGTNPAYALMTGGGHHSHIICTQCHSVIELDECDVDHLTSDLETRYRITLTGHLLELYGTCQNCLSIVSAVKDL